MHTIFSGIILCKESMAQYHILIKTEVIIFPEYAVMKEPFDEHYGALFGFAVNKVPSSSQVVFNILQQ